MAYLKQLAKPLCYDCPRRATVELYNHLNAPLGYYCAAHGKRKLGAVQSREGQNGES